MTASWTATPLAIRVDPVLAEAAVWRALTAPGPMAAEALAINRRRAEPIYGVMDSLEREAAFARLALAEFEELALDAPIRRAMAERPAMASRVRVALLGEASARADEGVTCEPGGEHIGIRIGVARFSDPADLLGWARHVLGHAEDTLDPTFGFQPGWEESGEGRVAAGIQARLHHLWDVSVDGRLAADGLLPEAPAWHRHHERIAADLPNVAAGAIDAVLGRLWHSARPAFSELLSWATRPLELIAAASPALADLPRSDRCPLCRFPSDDVVPPAPAIAASVAADYPDWRPDLGLCGRCTDRYRFARLLGGGP